MLGKNYRINKIIFDKTKNRDKEQMKKIHKYNTWIECVNKCTDIQSVKQMDDIDNLFCCL